MEKKKNISWNVIRTMLFLIIGLMNTVFVKPEDVGTWKNYLGYGLLILALVDAFFLIRSKARITKGE
ncbi:MAG: hypothetical protein HWE09_13690 [Cyclobacteriaceae bacterium]|nr:hypothetical protein [Cyclobacteriaceae bacterium]